ncbi:hypothetical protein PRIPAC_90024 [Pristionchus pacificus]|uniref:Uncharacterized protein n=1 Tax=Pristionchus pacificus TaxID=54126 RepID=A0A2A6CXZ5_PRIPA|nr:hypothetical protein PRIPAC_90024 [Pristionchus pacificus]|eukprot:PDM83094.1 hypothetical protein PRIPAC_37487 [Pristionchus pacificus]
MLFCFHKLVQRSRTTEAINYGLVINSATIPTASISNSILCEERLHVNTVNELELLIRERIQLRLAVTKSCPRFELFIGTELDEFTRLVFHLNRKGLRKLDVDSPDELPPLSTSLYNRECEEDETMLLNVTMDIIDNTKFLVFTDKSQRFTRPKNRRDVHFSLLLHQVRPCCVVKFDLELFSQKRKQKYIVLNRIPSTVLLTTTPKPIMEQDSCCIWRFPFLGTLRCLWLNAISILTLQSDGSSAPCAMKEKANPAKLDALTSSVNEEWIGSFIVIASVIGSFIAISVVLGIALCICVLMPPTVEKKGGGKRMAFRRWSIWSTE